MEKDIEKIEKFLKLVEEVKTIYTGDEVIPRDIPEQEIKNLINRVKELENKDKMCGDAIDEATMLKQIKNKLKEKNIPIETLLGELNRLEDIEDKKVQIEYKKVFNEGVKSVENKIKEKIEFYKRYGKIKNSNEYVMSVEIFVLQELLEE